MMQTAAHGHEANANLWLRWMVALFVVEWLFLAWQPNDRKDWLLENVLSLAVGVWLMWNHRRAPLSMTSYVLLFLFGVLHEIGAHYTYAQVPYDQWAQHLGDFSIDAQFGFQRNQFDRLVHFLFGLLMVQPIRELLVPRKEVRGRATLWVPVMIISTISMIYELVEWAAAEIFGGDLGQAYLGTQGDVWDAHKDMAMALLGSLIAMAWIALRGGGKSAVQA